ncbi:MAG: nuclear transport factor 2 family protein [Pyrinomonadaceae bacterium]
MLDVFNDQVDAFIKEDVGRLVNNVSDDFKYFYISSDELVLEVEGKDQFEKSMRAYFGRGRKVFSKIESYFIDKNRITFKEIVSHKNKNGETVSSSAIGTYEIKNGKITRSWYFVD